MEEFLLDRNANVSILFEEEEIPENLDLDSSFLALAVPSMEGKTQFVFVCERIKPLYFPISQLSKASQPIYNNFRSLAKTLHDCEHADLIALNHQVPSATELRQVYHNVDLFTLGFFKALAQKSSEVPEEVSWMEFLAATPSFTFAPLSVAEAEADETFLEGFALFLDEFTGSDENRLIKNVGRSVEIL